MHSYTYVLQSQENGRFYIGLSDNIIKRLDSHNKGRNKYTKRFIPWNLVWFQKCNSRSEAYKLEQKLKKMKSRKRVIAYMEKYPPNAELDKIKLSHLLE